MGHIFVEFHRDLGPPMNPAARHACSHKGWRRHGRCGPSRPGRCQGGEGSQTLRFFQGGARCSNGEDETEIWEGMVVLDGMLTGLWKRLFERRLHLFGFGFGLQCTFEKQGGRGNAASGQWHSSACHQLAMLDISSNNLILKNLRPFGPACWVSSVLSRCMEDIWPFWMPKSVCNRSTFISTSFVMFPPVCSQRAS